MKQIGSIQILRALAALMVVLAHAQDDSAAEAAKAGVAFVRSGLLPWVAGVDLFFVISGFIMVLAAEHLYAAPGAASAFLTRRVIRIVPLYWLVTAIMLVVFAALAHHGQANPPSLGEVAASLGFVPYAPGGRCAASGRPARLDAQLRDVLLSSSSQRSSPYAGRRRSRAWRRASCSSSRWEPSRTRRRPSLAYWSDPIVLEFVLGMGLALAYRRGLRLPPPVSVALAAAAAAILALDLAHMAKVEAFGVDPNGFARLLACGVPMAALFAAIVLMRPPLPTEGRVATPLAVLGDASYALYLFHPIIVVLARKAYLAAHLAPRLGFWPLVAADMIAACMLALAIHLLVERPVTAALQACFTGRRRAAPTPVRAPSAAAAPPAPAPSRGR